jgi:hypothetical protein
VDAYRELPRERRRLPAARAPAEARPAERSHAAIPVAVVVVGLGLYFATYSLLVPALLGLVLMTSGLSLLSSRLNPLSPHFYLTKKPSWAAIGVVLLAGLALVVQAYELWRTSGPGDLVHP